jgi:hypothetical protein
VQQNKHYALLQSGNTQLVLRSKTEQRPTLVPRPVDPESALIHDPDGLLGEIRRNSRYPRADWMRLEMSGPADPVAISTSLRAILDEAEAFVAQMAVRKGRTCSSSKLAR